MKKSMRDIKNLKHYLTKLKNQKKENYFQQKEEYHNKQNKCMQQEIELTV
jgi:hypothetical protein